MPTRIVNLTFDVRPTTCSHRCVFRRHFSNRATNGRTPMGRDDTFVESLPPLRCLNPKPTFHKSTPLAPPRPTVEHPAGDAVRCRPYTVGRAFPWPVAQPIGTSATTPHLSTSPTVWRYVRTIAFVPPGVYVFTTFPVVVFRVYVVFGRCVVGGAFCASVCSLRADVAHLVWHACCPLGVARPPPTLLATGDVRICLRPCFRPLLVDGRWGHVGHNNLDDCNVRCSSPSGGGWGHV